MAIYYCELCKHTVDENIKGANELVTDPVASGLCCDDCVERLEARGEGYQCRRCELIFVGPIKYTFSNPYSSAADEPTCDRCQEIAYDKSLEKRAEEAY